MFLKRGDPEAGSVPRCSFPAAAFSAGQFKNICLRSGQCIGQVKSLNSCAYVGQVNYYLITQK